MTDAYDRVAPGLSSPAVDAESITPGNGTLGHVTRAIYVGGGGDLAVEFMSGTQVTLRGVPAGVILPIRLRKVLASGTSATNIIGLW
ncbi:hypothetical protein [Pseudoruegeria sp. SK021]|uniref:spike base protein, RCAP_Rcc01079 family n=1 Tax=Pseudoruegeria sp. SK021 TaxID=1933035 RepID=UPI000A256BAC|nr:hypothetical protein [Pseudoruegeria sp. SK021]OSP55723.1 hypothetical protein BV911_06350 [Pseudoruegeria sp. SK021]